MPLSLTLADTFSHGATFSNPRQRVAFSPNSAYCAVGIYDDFGYGVGVSPAEVWVYKQAGGHWSQVGTLVTSSVWSNNEAYQLAIADNSTVLAVGSNTAYVQRWKSSGVDTWAARTQFYCDPAQGENENGWSGVAISADGNVCYIWNDYNGGNDGKIFTAVTSGAPGPTLRQTFNLNTYSPMGGVLSSDGKRLLFVDTVTSDLRVWVSTTLGTSSWTNANNTASVFPVAYAQGMKMTADMNTVVVGTDLGLGGGLYIEVFDNSTGSVYVSSGTHVATDYSSTLSFGLANDGRMIFSGDETGINDYTTLYSLDDVAATIGNNPALSDTVAVPAGVIANNWVGSVDLSPDGLWACSLNFNTSNVIDDGRIYFFSVAELPPLFWKSHVQSVEARS